MQYHHCFLKLWRVHRKERVLVFHAGKFDTSYDIKRVVEAQTLIKNLHGRKCNKSTARNTEIV